MLTWVVNLCKNHKLWKLIGFLREYKMTKSKTVYNLNEGKEKIFKKEKIKENREKNRKN